MACSISQVCSGQAGAGKKKKKSLTSKRDSSKYKSSKEGHAEI